VSDPNDPNPKKPAFHFQLPPQFQLALGVALKEVGKIGAKALASGVKSVTGDVRRAVREADGYLKGVEERAKKRSEDPNEEEE